MLFEKGFKIEIFEFLRQKFLYENLCFRINGVVGRGS